jgi:hypothetical protein
MKNLNFKLFLSEVVIPTTPEDQKDSVFFEFKEWIESGFKGVPSTEVQRLVDKNMPVWFSDFDNAVEFISQIWKTLGKKVAIQITVAVARYVVEKHWKNTEDQSQIRAVELAEKWLKDESSVTASELEAAGNEAISEGSAIAYMAGDAAWTAGYATGPSKIRGASYAEFTMHWAAKSTSQKEVCEVIFEKLPRFCYEDLFQWGYFDSLQIRLTERRV